MSENIDFLPYGYKDFKSISKENDLILMYMISRYCDYERKRRVFIRDVHGMCLYLCECYERWTERISRRWSRDKDVSFFIRRFSRRFDASSYICDSELLFLKDDEQKCFIAWYYCRVKRNGRNYFRMKLPLAPTSHREMYAIVRYFIFMLNYDFQDKKELLDDIHEFCSEYDNNKSALKSPFGWIDSGDDGFVSWAWDYSRNEMINAEVDSVEQSKKVFLLTAAFYVWEAHRDTKKLFLKGMRAAWSQKKFRDKNKSNGRLNTYIGQEAKGVLDFLVGADRSSIKDVLEKLILDEAVRRNIDVS